MLRIVVCSAVLAVTTFQSAHGQNGMLPPVERRVSSHEVNVPYVGDPGFWDRPDLFVMAPDIAPKDRWPDQVQRPSAHGVKIIVLLPGDYRNRSNGRLPPGVLFIESSGTASQPLLVCFAPHVDADLRKVNHPAERFGENEALLTALRIWKQKHQYICGLTFAEGGGTSLLREATANVVDSCLWHEVKPQPLRIRFDSQRNLIQRCVMRRFRKDQWGAGDTVAINVSDGACTHNRIVSNVILNYTDSYQHTDRDGDDYGLGAGTIIDGNWMGFTPEAYIRDTTGELMYGENSIDLKMGGTESEPVRITNNVFFGTRAAKAGCAASGSGGYAVTFHRRGTWVEMSNNLFVDVDSGVFLNSFFLDVVPAKGRIDPHLSIRQNVFTGVRSRASAFPDRTGRVLSGASPTTFTHNQIIDSERLMQREPPPGPWDLVIAKNHIYGSLEFAPRNKSQLEADGNEIHEGPFGKPVELRVPWVERTLRCRLP